MDTYLCALGNLHKSWSDFDRLAQRLSKFSKNFAKIVKIQQKFLQVSQISDIQMGN